MSTTAERPRHYRRPLGQTLVEWGLLLLVVATGALTFMARRVGELGSNPLLDATLFYRIDIVGVLPVGARPFLLSAELLGVAVAVVLVVMALLPRLRPDVRGAAVAFGVVLLLAPVLNYEPRVELLGYTKDDLAILTKDAPADLKSSFQPDVFQPLLPVTYPLLAAALLLVAWLLVTPAADRPPAAVAFGLVTTFLIVGGWLLTHELWRARGVHWDYVHTLWAPLLASLWVLGQLGVAATAAAAAARDNLRSRVLCSAAALILVVTFVLTRGKP